MRRLRREGGQVFWRWNGRPLRVRIRWLGTVWEIAWERWHPRGGWSTWRSYRAPGELRSVIGYYRDYARYWRGEDVF